MLTQKEIRALWWKNMTDRRRERPDLKEQQDLSGHGNRRTYDYWFCRCPKCTAANTRYTKIKRLNRLRQGK